MRSVSNHSSGRTIILILIATSIPLLKQNRIVLAQEQNNQTSSSQQQPTTGIAQPHSYRHVWVDGAGTTHQTKCEFRDFSPLSLGKGVEPILIDRLPDMPTQVAIAQFPKGWVGQWHENPATQWIIPLSGRWFVETMDGHRVEMGPGDASLGEDQGSHTSHHITFILRTDGI
jgi:hypothetical protein